MRMSPRHALSLLQTEPTETKAGKGYKKMEDAESNGRRERGESKRPEEKWSGTERGMERAASLEHREEKKGVQGETELLGLCREDRVQYFCSRLIPFSLHDNELTDDQSQGRHTRDTHTQQERESLRREAKCDGEKRFGIDCSDPPYPHVPRNRTLSADFHFSLLRRLFSPGIAILFFLLHVSLIFPLFPPPAFPACDYCELLYVSLSPLEIKRVETENNV